MIFKSYTDFWKRTFDFSGRSTRSDFWVPFLTHIFIFLFVFYVGAIIDAPLVRYVVLITIVPSFTVTARRLHDINRGLLFAFLFPISAVSAPTGGIAAFIGMLAWAGTGGTNQIAAVIIVSSLSLILGVIIILYSLFLFILPGNKTANKYGSGGSCVTSSTEI